MIHKCSRRRVKINGIKLGDEMSSGNRKEMSFERSSKDFKTNLIDSIRCAQRPNSHKTLKKVNNEIRITFMNKCTPKFSEK